jgi:hypothetical protein
MEFNMLQNLTRLVIIMFLGMVVVAGVATSAYAEEVVCPEGYVCTQSGTDSNVTTNGQMTTTIKQPPPSAISPQFSAGSNNDLCTIGASASVQTQILGISAGGTYTEENCKRLKNAKVLYDMGMKVAAVSTMCQDENVFKAMMNAGTPCPYQGLIGDAAKLGWETHVEETEQELKLMGPIDAEKAAPVVGAGLLAFLLLL